MGEILMSGGGSTSGEVTVSGGGIAPSICKNLMITKSGVNVSLKWQDPDDTILDSQYLCSWAGTKIVKKLGSYPTDETDGTLVLTNTTKNQYLNSAYVDVLASASDDYKYAAFPYSTNGVYCYNDRNLFTEAIIYEFCINPNDSNPDSRVTYPAGCTNANFSPAYMNFSGGNFSYRDWETDRKSTRLNSSHSAKSRMPSSA